MRLGTSGRAALPCRRGCGARGEGKAQLEVAWRPAGRRALLCGPMPRECSRGDDEDAAPRFGRSARAWLGGSAGASATRQFGSLPALMLASALIVIVVVARALEVRPGSFG